MLPSHTPKKRARPIIMNTPNNNKEKDEYGSDENDDCDGERKIGKILSPSLVRRSPTTTTMATTITTPTSRTGSSSRTTTPQSRTSRRARNLRHRLLVQLPSPVWLFFLVWLGIILWSYRYFYQWQSSLEQFEKQQNTTISQHQLRHHLLPSSHLYHPHNIASVASSSLSRLGQQRKQGSSSLWNNLMKKNATESSILSRNVMHHDLIEPTFSSSKEEEYQAKDDSAESNDEDVGYSDDIDNKEDGNSGDGEEDGEHDSEDDDGESFSSTDDSNSKTKIVHIVHTRFMQQQPNLVELGLARLLLFKTVFLSTLEEQTSQNFIVVVRTDPQLDPVLRGAFMQILEQSSLPLNRIIVLPSNGHPRISYPNTVSHLMNIHDTTAKSDDQHHQIQFNYPNSHNQILWKAATQSNDHDTIETIPEIWFGNVTDALEYLIPSSSSSFQSSPLSEKDDGGDIIDASWGIVETRLDADDGLSKLFVEELQHEAIHDYFNNNGGAATYGNGGDDGNGTRSKSFKQPPQQNRSSLNHRSNNTISSSSSDTWRIWCAGQHFEWQFDSPWKKAQRHEQKEDKYTGSLVILKMNGCITAGLSTAYRLPVEGLPPLPMLGHQELYNRVPRCQKRTEISPNSTNNDDGGVINCLSILDLKPSALRARTITSGKFLFFFFGRASAAHFPLLF